MRRLEDTQGFERTILSGAGSEESRLEPCAYAGHLY